MFCKFCGNEMEQGEKFCPACGKKQEKAGSKILAVILGVLLAGAVLCLAIALTVAVVLGMNLGGGSDVETTQATTQAVEGTEGNAVVGAPEGSVSYTVTDEQAKAAADEVVAVVGDTKLTNAQLQILYRAQVYGFLNEYYYYLSMIGMDLTQGLDQQTCMMDNTKSWQEYFLEGAVENWKSYAVLMEMAKAEGYTLTEAAQQNIDNIESDMMADVTAGGYADLDAMILDQGGAGATKQGLMDYQKLIFTAMDYFDTKYAGMTPNAQEIEDYYQKNEQAMIDAGKGKDAGKTVDVRHILIKVAGGTTDAEGNVTYSDQDWANCQTKAQQIYDSWLSGEATEDSFAALANEASEDGGSNTNGGLYTGVAAGEMVTAFNDWIMDASRKEGDSGLVKTEFGYHVMYYCADQAVWYTAAKDALLSERFQAFFSSGEEQYPMEADYSKIVLGDLKLS